jgi:hypothetical protein
VPPNGTTSKYSAKQSFAGLASANQLNDQQMQAHETYLEIIFCLLAVHEKQARFWLICLHMPNAFVLYLSAHKLAAVFMS